MPGLSIVAACALAWAAAPPRGPEHVLVLDVKGSVITADEGALLRDAFAAQVADIENIEVISAEDMRRVLDVEADKQQAGCDSDACLAELGAALGASKVLYSSVARLGDTLVLTATLVDPTSARSLARGEREDRSVEALRRRVPGLVDELFAVAPAPGFPIVTAGGGVVLGLGLVATAVSGGALFFLYDNAHNPRGDGALKQVFLDSAEGLVVATGACAGVAALGGLITVIGIAVE